MERKGSLPYYSQPLNHNLSQINPAHFPKPNNLNNHFNIIIPSTPKPSKYSLPFMFYDDFVLVLSYPPSGLYARPSSHLNHLSPEVYITKRLRWSRGSMLAFGTQVRGFKPGRSLLIFQGEKILSTPSFAREEKPFVVDLRHVKDP